MLNGLKKQLDQYKDIASHAGDVELAKKIRAEYDWLDANYNPMLGPNDNKNPDVIKRIKGFLADVRGKDSEKFKEAHEKVLGQKHRVATDGLDMNQRAKIGYGEK